MRTIVKIAAIFSLSLAGGCAAFDPIPPSSIVPPAPRCDFTIYPLQAEVPDQAAAASQAPTAGDVMDARLAARRAAPGPQKMLFMSGGSQHGAFGAGLLSQWAEREGGRLPDFTVVTGVSTGSILATFAFIGEPAILAGPEGYGIMHESQLLTPVLNNRNTFAEVASLPKVLRAGAVADLEPLRANIRKVVTDEVLAKVAAGRENHRLLMVGAVDVDTGQGAAFDLTEMAARAMAATGAARDQLRNCYVDAIVASSSAPMAAPPVFIDNRMYVDGGARFGVFSNEVGEKLSAASADPEATAYLIVNGTLAMVPRCGAEPVDCPADGGPVPPGLAPPHRGWSLLDVALRSVDILEHQVYALSVERILLQSEEQGERLRFARILTDGQYDADAHVFTMPAGSGFGQDGETHTCSGWSAIDKRIDNPLQFHPRYMRCLIHYGRARMDADLQWYADRVAANAPTP